MSLFLATTVDGLQLGLCYAIAALGMYIAYSILDFPDLTADGSFPLGGVVGTILIYRCGFSPLLALFGGALAGAVAGVLTGVLHVRFGITKLLAGIITMTALLSGTLLLTTFLTGTSFSTTNFSYVVNGFSGIFNPGVSTVLPDYLVLLILLGLCLGVKILLDLFFACRLGFILRAAGNNEKLVTSLGKNVGTYKILGLSLTNGLVAFSGALYAQLNMNYDNTCGSGKVVLTLAAIIIGTALFSKARHIRSTTAVIIGALIYSLCLNYFALLDTDGLYLKLMNALCFAAILIADHTLKKQRVRNAGVPRGEG